ncbi:MAG: hypothetical protein ACE5JU_10095, partial [Candidatus Binatia bacterium]
ELGTLHDGPAMVLFDEGLIPRAVLGVIKGLPRLDIHDVKGKRRAVLGETPDGSPRLELYSAKGQRRARLGIQADTANLGLYDQTGRPRLGLNVLAHGEPILIFIDKNEKIQASLDLLPDGTAGLTINDKDGRASLWLGARLEGLGLTIFDKDGTSRAVLGSTSLEAIGTGAITERPESSLVLFNREGRVIWSTP